MKELELDMYADDDSAPELKSYYLFAVCMHSGETLQHGQFSSNNLYSNNLFEFRNKFIKINFL